jgi:hypothetical protein
MSSTSVFTGLIDCDGTPFFVFRNVTSTVFLSDEQENPLTNRLDKPH